MKLTLLQDNLRPITYKFITESEDVRNLNYREDESGNHLYTFDYVGKDFEYFVHLLAIMGMSFVMYGTSADKYHFVKLDQDGLEHDVLPIVDGVVKYHEDVIVGEFIENIRKFTKEQLFADEYFNALSKESQNVILTNLN